MGILRRYEIKAEWDDDDDHEFDTIECYESSLWLELWTYMQRNFSDWEHPEFFVLSARDVTDPNNVSDWDSFSVEVQAVPEFTFTEPSFYTE